MPYDSTSEWKGNDLRKASKNEEEGHRTDKIIHTLKPRYGYSNMFDNMYESKETLSHFLKVIEPGLDLYRMSGKAHKSTRKSPRWTSKMQAKNVKKIEEAHGVSRPV